MKKNRYNMGILKERTPKEHVFNLINLSQLHNLTLYVSTLWLKQKHDPFGGCKHSVESREHKHFIRSDLSTVKCCCSTDWSDVESSQSRTWT